MSFVKEKIAEDNLSSEDPIVVVLDMNIKSRPGQSLSIFMDPGLQ